MSKLSQIFVLLSIAIIMAFSVSMGSKVGVPNHLPDSSSKKHSPSTLSDANVHNALYLQELKENINFGNHSPSASSKNQLKDFLKDSYAFELKVQSSLSQYILYSKVINQSLAISDIIFPFQYFW